MNDSEMRSLVLSYWQKHPNARDTAEGIAKWWLPKELLVFETAETKRILEQLVEENYLVKLDTTLRTDPTYALNEQTRDEECIAPSES